jgi:biopolymer transport protein ExbD
MFIGRNKVAESFGSHGTEGMLDVVLGCTLIFLLMSSLISVGEAEAQEKTLPAVKLSQSSTKLPGGQKIKKNVITLRNSGKTPLVFFDDRQISMDELKIELQKLAGIGHIALRRDHDLPCAWEDRIIMLCKNSGIEKIAIVVSEPKKR